LFGGARTVPWPGALPAPGRRRAAANPNAEEPLVVQDRGPSALALERVVLLGYMCSGKSTVGEALARRLEWRYLDFDVEIEHREGRSVKDITADGGEDVLREMEAALTAEVADETGVVLAPGGGWITRPENLERLGRGTLSVWLRVSVPETVRRLRADDIDRPFRDHPEPERMIAAMLEEREPLYRRASLMVPAEGRTPEEIAYELEQVVRTRRAAFC
jgi:shikimate kinase